MLARASAMGASFLVLVAIFVPLERLFPARPGQRMARPALGVDAMFFVGQYMVWNGASIAILVVVQAAIAAHARAFQSGAARLPMGIAIGVAVVAGDLLVYAFHRACHAWGPLWRFHAVHHSAEHLDFLAAHREHPVDGIATQLCQNLPAMALGIPAFGLAALAVFRGIWAVFVHSNVRVPLGPLRWVLGAPELHHWHHACVTRTVHNFANLAPWIDLVFGTHHCPEAGEAYALGLGEKRRRGYLGELARPFGRDQGIGRAHGPARACADERADERSEEGAPARRCG